MYICWHKCFLYLFFSLLCSVTLHAQQQYFISDIQIVGNKHTKSHIILRELDVKKGDSVKVHRLEHLMTVSKENLENMALFNFVEINYSLATENDNRIVLQVRVEERWYIIPMFNPIVEDRNTSAWIQKWDFSRVTLEFGTLIYNLWGLNHTLMTSVQIGYNQSINFNYRNITLDKRQKHFITIGASVQRSHYLDVMTDEDAPLSLKTPEFILNQGIGWSLNYTFKHNVRTTHNVSFYGDYRKIADTVLVIHPEYWGDDRTERLNLQLQYFFKKDHRDYIPYPRKGYLLKTGAHIYTTTDLSVRYAQLYMNAHYYWNPGGRWYVSEKLAAGISAKNVKAYILDQALGYGEGALRGYEYHVVDGQHYINLNSTLKYNILPKTVFVINWLSALSKFNKIHFALYANTFFDMGIAYHRYPGTTNHLSNRFLYSGGVGLDLVTYYDMVFSLHYSMNKQQEHGLFFAFKLPFM